MRHTTETDATMLRVLAKHTEMGPALTEICREIGRAITADAVDKRLRTQGHGSAFSRLGKRVLLIPAVDSSASHARFEPLISLARKYAKRGGLTLEHVCDEMDMSPSKGRDLIEAAKVAGYNLEVHHGTLELRAPEPSRVEVPVADAPDMPGEEIRWGVVSDPHIGSKHHNDYALCKHVEYLQSIGMKHILGPGDWVPGGYRFLKYEVTRTGIEDQCELAKEKLQSFGRDLVWHSIAGNHDESFDVGIDASRMIARMMNEDGWTNFRHYGARGARLILNGTRVGLHHPGGSLGYAQSYKIQRYIDNTPPAERPEVLFTGHTHQSLYFERGGVHAFLCGTFENGDSSFGRMIGGDVQLGGWVISLVRDPTGIASIKPEFRKYPQKRMVYVKAG